MKEWYRKNSWFLLATALCCLPLFFINVKDSHDWGDDFAQYLIQAENIVEGRPQTETGYVYDKRFPVVAPPAYPAGFPLLLAPVYAAFGHSIYAYNLLITTGLFLLCLLMGLFFRQYFSATASVLLVLVFAYNEWTLYFKTNILSDIPFALFLLACTICYRQMQGLRGALVTGLLAGFLLLLRGAGIVFLAAVLAHSAFLYFRSPLERKRTLLRLLILAGTALVLSLGVNWILKIPSEGFFGFYGQAYAGKDAGDSILQNLNYYTEVFKAFFQPRVEDWKFASSALASVCLALLILGMIYSYVRERSYWDLVAGFYILLFMLYPYSAGGFRFILPVIPFLLVYMARGMMMLLPVSWIPRSVILGAAALALVLFYNPSLARVVEHEKDIPEGPQRQESQEMLQYIHSHLQSHDLVLFIKPKALALYGRVKTCSTVHYQEAADVKEMCEVLGVDYLLVTLDAADAPLEKCLAAYPEIARRQWQNGRFALYKRNP